MPIITAAVMACGKCRCAAVIVLDAEGNPLMTCPECGDVFLFYSGYLIPLRFNGEPPASEDVGVWSSE
jgi:hypothetical protein